MRDNKLILQVIESETPREGQTTALGALDACPTCSGDPPGRLLRHLNSDLYASPLGNH